MILRSRGLQSHSGKEPTPVADLVVVESVTRKGFRRPLGGLGLDSVRSSQ